MSNIYMKKGIFDWFNSLLSYKKYLENIINIMIDTSTNKLEFIFKVLQTSVNNYFKNLINLIEQNVIIVTMKYNEKQIENWKSICLSFEETRKQILQMDI